MKTLFIECAYASEKDVKAIINSVIKQLGERKRVGLISTIQYLGILQELKSGLTEAGFLPVIGKPRGHAIKPGQILGCDVSAASAIASDIDCFVFIGDGRFHPVGVIIETGKSVVSVDVMGNVKEFGLNEIKLYLARKTLNKIDAAKANSFGILVSTKPGQGRMSYALSIRKELLANGKEAIILMSDEIIPENLISFPQIDAWINTACPRIPLEDAFRYRKPVVNWEDVKTDLRKQ